MTEDERYDALATVLALRDHYAPDLSPLGRVAQISAQTLAECIIGRTPAAVSADMETPTTPMNPRPLPAAAPAAQPAEELPDDDPFGLAAPSPAKQEPADADDEPPF